MIFSVSLSLSAGVAKRHLEGGRGSIGPRGRRGGERGQEVEAVDADARPPEGAGAVPEDRQGVERGGRGREEAELRATGKKAMQ